MNRIVHDAVRRDLDRFAAALARFPESERQRAGQLAEASRFLRTMLTLHHEGEDKIRCKHGIQRCDDPPTPPVSFAAPGLRLSNTGGDCAWQHENTETTALVAECGVRDDPDGGRRTVLDSAMPIVR